MVTRHGGRHHEARRQKVTALPGHSPLIFAALMMGHHFSMSAFCSAPSASGVCWSRGGISRPSSASRLRTFASAKASTTAALSFWMMSFGVPLGAKSAFQVKISNPDNPASSAVGMFGAEGMRLLPVTAYALIVPARTCGSAVTGSAAIISICPATKSCIAGPEPRLKARPGFLLKEHAHDMLHVANSPVPQRCLVRVRLQPCDEAFQVIRWDAIPHNK